MTPKGMFLLTVARTFKLNWSSYNKENFEEYSLYVGNLDPRISEAEIKNFFLSFYSSVKSVKLITFNGSRISKGYGFVKFLNAEEYKRSLREMNGKLFCNRPLIVK